MRIYLRDIDKIHIYFMDRSIIFIYLGETPEKPLYTEDEIRRRGNQLILK